MTDETAELKAQISALQQRMEELERKAKPPEPFVSDYVPPSPFRLLDRVSMPASVMREIAAAMPDAMVRDIFRDARTPETLAPLSTDVRPRPAATGWEAPLSPPAGISLIDRQLDVQDQRDRAERIMQHARMKAVEKKEG